MRLGEQFGRRNANRCELRLVAQFARCAAGNPLEQHLIVIASGLDANAAAMWHLTGGLTQQQASLRAGQGYAPATSVFGQGGVVEVRVESQQRKLKAVLPASLPV